MATSKLGFVPLSQNFLAPPGNLSSFKCNVENMQSLSPESKDLRFKNAQSELGKYGSSRSEYLDPDLAGVGTQRGSRPKEKSTEKIVPGDLDRENRSHTKSFTNLVRLRLASEEISPRKTKG